jgi:L-fucose isomerase-like protein
MLKGDIHLMSSTKYFALGLIVGNRSFFSDARRRADLFRKHRDDIDGAVVSLRNFGDELGVANCMRRSGLDAPVLTQAFPDVCVLTSARAKAPRIRLRASAVMA